MVFASDFPTDSCTSGKFSFLESSSFLEEKILNGPRIMISEIHFLVNMCLESNSYSLSGGAEAYLDLVDGAYDQLPVETCHL